MGEQEWSDALFLQYGLEPPDLPKYCDGCNAKFTIFHALNCKGRPYHSASKRDPVRGADLAGKAFTPSQVHDYPLIFACCALKRPESKPTETKGSTDQDGAPPPEATEHK